MRRITQALLGAAYLCLACALATLVWRTGGGWGGGLAAGFGVLGLCMGLHGVFARAFDRTTLDAQLQPLRTANLLLADKLEQLAASHEQLVDHVEQVAAERTASPALAQEVHALEAEVARLGESLEARLAGRVLAAPPSANSRAHALLETVREALAANRVDLYLQPVVGLPQRRTVFYESFSRLRDATGRVMMPAEYLQVAEPEGLVTAIDNLLLFRCVQIVRRLARNDRKVGIFCNVSTASLADETFFPQFLEFLSENRDLAPSLIFELGQAAFEARGAVEARNMAKLADLGFRFSLDKVTDLDLDVQDLARADVGFVKVGAAKLLGEVLEVDGRLTLKSLKDIQAADYAALMRRYGVEVIAEKVESEREVVDILELDIAYGQGHLFGEPRAIRDAVLAETAPPPDFLRGALRKRLRA